MATSFKPCSVEGCNGNAHYLAKGARGMCASHDRRWRLYGDPNEGRVSPGEPLRWAREVAVLFDGDGCLTWPFSRFPDGYGALVTPDARSSRASRVICTFSHGEPPSSHHEAAHSCGKGHEGCVSPKHLRWATKAENAADRTDHGTHGRGDENGMSKLTEDDVLEIRSLQGAMTQQAIANLFGVDRTQVGNILRRKQWAWLE